MSQPTGKYQIIGVDTGTCLVLFVYHNLPHVEKPNRDRVFSMRRHNEMLIPNPEQCHLS